MELNEDVLLVDYELEPWKCPCTWNQMLFINMCRQSANLELLTVSAVIIASTVIYIELTLKWNAISDVYDIESSRLDSSFRS